MKTNCSNLGTYFTYFSHFTHNSLGKTGHMISFLIIKKHGSVSLLRARNGAETGIIGK